MDVRSRQSIVEHLQKEDVQERIVQSIHRGRDEATVTISRAAELFGITENKLRDWEEYGFLNPLRPSGPKSRRLYTPTELDKLAIIRELINVGYPASDIPPDIDQLWHTIRTTKDVLFPGSNQHDGQHIRHVSAQPYLEEPSINQRISQARDDLFWRYFVSHSLRLALHLICEDISNTTVGLILPLSPTVDISKILRIEDLSSLGESLVGWLSQNGSSQTLLTSRPWFQYSSDFRLEHLQKSDSQSGTAQATDDPAHHTLIVIQREANSINLSDETVEAIQRLLQPLYEHASRSRSCLGFGFRDISDTVTGFSNSPNNEDLVLNGLVDMVISLGGQTANGESRWHLCWILLPRDPSQPLHMSNLVIRAQNQDATYSSRLTQAAFDKHSSHPYIRALLSRHIIYQSNIPVSESQALFRNQEPPIRSAVALPIAGENGIPLGVLYVASHLPEAFPPADQRVLRMMNRIIEELLKTYQIRHQATQHVSDMIKNPELVDTLFDSIASENDFNRDVEQLLSTLQYADLDLRKSEFFASSVVSFIAVDIDKLNSLSNKYGDRAARNLTREVGLRIQEQIRTFFKEYPECQLYHIHADRFFILLRNTTLEQTREHAERLRIGTIGTYKLDALRVYPDQHVRPESMIELNDITVRLGITSYPYLKLSEILREHTSEFAIPEVRSIITSALEVALAKGQIEGGNVVISWDYELRNFMRWSPAKK